MKPSGAVERDQHETDCLVHNVATVLAAEPALEAVTFNKDRRQISVATLGKAADPALEEKVASIIQRAQQSDSPKCGLLQGESDCASCEVPFARYERDAITIQHSADTTTIARVTCPTAPRFWQWKDLPWPKLSHREIEIPDDATAPGEWKWQFLAAALCGIFGLAATFALAPESSLKPLFFLCSYVAGGWFTLTEVFERLRERKIDVHFLMLAVAAGSASIGAWSEGSALLFLFSLSGAMEHYAMRRTQREIESLFKSAPKMAIVLDEQGRETSVPVERLVPGMHLLIKPGAQFPADAELLKGETASDESNLTGEATPVEKGVGETVLAGTLNLWGAVEVIVLRSANESALQKIIRLIKEAQHLKAPAQRLTDKFGTGYTYGILGLSAGMFFVWWLAFGLPPFSSTAARQSAFYRAMTLLVVASPCALVLSIPSAVLAAVAWGARRGILFRGGAAVEKLAQVSVVAMDKTGTLTTGEFQIAGIESFPPGREGEVEHLASSVERLSSHPLARAITRAAKKKSLVPLELEKVESISGHGVQAQISGETLLVGRREFVKPDPAILEKLAEPEPGTSEVWLRHGSLTGRILLRDALRAEARKVVAELHNAGLQTVVLTGDRQSTADHLKTALGVADVRAGLKPDEKLAVIRSFTRENRLVAMIGDGVNDAPSLAAAHVGVAMGARGSDAALEQAEVVLMNDRLENFWAAYQLSRKARQIIHQNLVISLGTVVVLVIMALAGIIPLTVGVIGHEGSTVIVVMNSLRLLFQKP